MKLTAMFLSFAMLMSGCNIQKESAAFREISENATEIVLSDEKITVNGAEVSGDETAPVYTANDIVYYPEGKDFTFGEGEKQDEHSKEEADSHTVVHIKKPGDYILSGKLSSGQVAVDLGEDAEKDPEAVVTLVLDGLDITCTVAPAVIFYNVYECGEKDEEKASKDVDTESAGANVIIKDGSVNNVNGSYVARIYKSVELSEDGKEVVDSKKLHKYDGAFYSKMSMNFYGEKKGDGVLNITAENEGLDTELHLTLNGGIINIKSGNDGINTNEDNISVCTINGGELNITVTGETGEGDGIDSNGWLIINGGKVTAFAYGESMDSGIDSDKGIHINGGTVIATGNMLDRIEGTQGYSVFSFGRGFDMTMNGKNTYTVKNAKGEAVVSCATENNFTNLVFSSDKLTEGEYSLWSGENKLRVAKTQGGMGMGGGMPPMRQQPGGEREFPEGTQAMGERPSGEFKNPDGSFEKREGNREIPNGAPQMRERPEGMPGSPEGMPPMGEMPDGMTPPDFERGGMVPPEKTPTKEQFEKMNNERLNFEYSDTFKIEKGANYFAVEIN